MPEECVRALGWVNAEMARKYSPSVSELGRRIKNQANKVKMSPKPITQEELFAAESTISSADIERLFEQGCDREPERCCPSGIEECNECDHKPAKEIKMNKKPETFRELVGMYADTLNSNGYEATIKSCDKHPDYMDAKLGITYHEEWYGYLNVYSSKKGRRLKYHEMKKSDQNVKLDSFFNNYK
jgi:hypothetical protein